jgi:hypothetical protein
MYTPSRFIKLYNVQSLFVQHLKLEGIILSDHRNWIRDLLKKFSPKVSYNKETEDSLALFRPADRVPSSDEGLMLTADTLYVALRNFGINYLATRKIYKFEFDNVLDALVDCIGGKYTEIGNLQNLRAFKTAYRERSGTPKFNTNWLDLTEEVSLLVQRWKPLGLPSSHHIRWLGGAYATLRDFECWAVNQIGLRKLDQNLIPDTIQSYWAMACKPRQYSFAIRQVDEEWVSIVNRNITDFFEHPKQPKHESLVLSTYHSAF